MDKDDFWKTPKGKAIIKMGLWLLFLILIYAFASIDTPAKLEVKEEEKETTEPVVKFALYADMQKKLLENNFSYIYKVKNKDELIIYSGKKKQLEEVGLKETNKEVTKYYKNQEGNFKVVLDKLEPIDDLYENIEEEIFDLKTFFSNLAGVNYTVNKQEQTRKIIYNTQNYSVEVETDLENITSITYKKEEKEYILLFQSIGKIEDISYNN